MIQATKEDIGKRVVFLSPTRWSNQKATRVIKEVFDDGKIAVRFGGHASFIVRKHEIIRIL